MDAHADSQSTPMMERRQFLKRTLGLPAAIAAAQITVPAPVAAMEPIPRRGPPQLRLSLAAYSFRDFLPGNKTAPPPERTMDLFSFMDFCAAQGCEGTELTSYYFPADLDDTFLRRIKRHAFLCGLTISGTAVGNTFTHPPGADRDREIAHVRKWIDYAQIMGAPHIRVFAGNAPKGVNLETAKRHCIESLEQCCEYAGTKGVFLGLENHGGIVADPKDLLDIIQSVQSPWVGINLDGGNFHTEDPYADLARCAPYAVNVQIKVEVTARGKAAQPVDLPRFIRVLRDARYQGFVALEYEAKPDPWTAVPRWLADIRKALDAA